MYSCCDVLHSFFGLPIAGCSCMAFGAKGASSMSPQSGVASTCRSQVFHQKPSDRSCRSIALRHLDCRLPAVPNSRPIGQGHTEKNATARRLQRIELRPHTQTSENFPWGRGAMHLPRSRDPQLFNANLRKLSPLQGPATPRRSWSPRPRDPRRKNPTAQTS